MRYLIRLLHFFKPYKWQFVVAFASVLAAGAFTMISPLLIGYAITYGLDPQKDAAGKVVSLNGNEGLLIIGCLGIVALALGKGLSLFGQQFLGEFIGQKVAYDIRNAIYDNLQRLSYAYHDKVQTGQIMSRVTQDVEGIRMFVSMGFLRSMYIVVVLAVSVTGMFIINWQLALVSLVTLPFMAWRSFVLAHTVRPIWLEVQQNIAEVTRIAEEALTGIRVVKAFSREDFESKKFYDAAENQANLSYTASRIMAVNQPALTGLGALQIAITVGVGAWMITQGNLTAAGLLTFALWLNLLQLPVRQMGFALTFVARCISSSERIFELLDAQSAVQEKPNAMVLKDVEGHVRFEGVAFGYDNLSAVLQDVDIDAPRGKVVALLGPAGSGKSTVVNLIPRFYDVTAGSVTIDGIDIRDVTLDSLRKNIGIVQQDVFLFIGTIRDNIAYGRPEATQEDIEAAAKAARIHDFITSLPYGYDEWVGERGVTLSGGQKQRIAIARTLLMNPRILIFDDSTASVDTQTEYLIQQALAELMHDRTTFVIAQRLRTIMRADEIVVLERGKVVQRGTHEELIAVEGLYRRIYDLELKDQEEALGHIVAAAQTNGTQPARPAPAAAGPSHHGSHSHGDEHTPGLRPAASHGGGGGAS